MNNLYNIIKIFFICLLCNLYTCNYINEKRESHINLLNHARLWAPELTQEWLRELGPWTNDRILPVVMVLDVKQLIKVNHSQLAQEPFSTENEFRRNFLINAIQTLKLNVLKTDLTISDYKTYYPYKTILSLIAYSGFSRLFLIFYALYDLDKL